MRELKNVAERYCLGLPDALPGVAPAADGAMALAAQVDRAERAAIETALRACAGNVALAAEQLQVPKKTLYDKLHRHGLVAEHYRG